MTPKDVRERVRSLCLLLDQGRRVAAVLAIPTALGLTTCASSQGPVEQSPIDEPAARPELLMDGLDNDGDGLVDCADPDCTNMEACAGIAKENVPMYGVPFEPPEPEPQPTEPCVPLDR